jgi:hypothetical protein
VSSTGWVGARTSRVPSTAASLCRAGIRVSGVPAACAGLATTPHLSSPLITSHHLTKAERKGSGSGHRSWQPTCMQDIQRRLVPIRSIARERLKTIATT